MKKEDFTHWNGIIPLWNDLKTVVTYFYIYTSFINGIRVNSESDMKDNVIQTRLWVDFDEVKSKCVLKSDVERDYIKRSDVEKLLRKGD